MSNNRTGDPAIPHERAWPRSERLQTMKIFIRIMAEEDLLDRIQPGQVASTYGVTVAEVESELMRHLREGEGI